MDSGNSGSMQSSSGGDEEYDSRAESITAFFNTSAHLPSSASNSRPQPPPAVAPAAHSSLFDAGSNYLDAFPRSPNPFMAWGRGGRPDPSCTDVSGGGLLGSPSAASSSPTIASREASRSLYQNMAASIQLPASDRPLPQAGDPPHVVRNSKKRSRASRRAPTTVLTTDTSNFRAMVQEFTGIPAPPFSASPFPRTRLDLFSGIRSGLSDPAPPPPPYLLRPFAQKLQPLSSSTSSAAAAAAMLDVLSSNATSTLVATTSNSNTAATTAAGNSNQSQPNLLNVNNPLFTFQSLLQSSAPPPKYPQLPNLPLFNSKAPADASLKMGLLEDFTIGNVSSLPGLMASEGGLPARSESAPNWAEGASNRDADPSELRSFNGGFENLQRNASNCKLNYSSSSTDFHAEKVPENVASRGEGMVDSWICSSD